MKVKYNIKVSEGTWTIEDIERSIFKEKNWSLRCEQPDQTMFVSLVDLEVLKQLIDFVLASDSKPLELEAQEPERQD